MNFTDSNLRDYSQADGGDIVFTSGNGRVQLDHEVVRYDSSDGTLVAWVKVPQLYSLTDTTLYMYYGHGVVSNQENPTGVWNSDYKGVYHFNENVNDSTHNYNGTDSGSSDTSGQIDRARDFQSPDRINFASSAWMSGYLDKITMQAWVNPDSISGYDTIVGFGTDGDYPTLSLKDGKISYWSSTTSPRELLSSDTLSTGTWSFVTVTYDGVTDQAKIYLNDNNDGMDSMSGSTYTGTNRWIGNDDNGEPFDGQLDEVRILDIVLSKNWIITEYNNQNSPNTFYSIGTAEALGS
jgi:hypothetical protein